MVQYRPNEPRAREIVGSRNLRWESRFFPWESRLANIGNDISPGLFAVTPRNLLFYSRSFARVSFYIKNELSLPTTNADGHSTVAALLFDKSRYDLLRRSSEFLMHYFPPVAPGTSNRARGVRPEGGTPRSTRAALSDLPRRIDGGRFGNR